jgi:DNA-binding response OmpR family regulator
MTSPAGSFPVWSASVLLVEDDEVIGAELARGLTAAGMAVEWCRTGSEAQQGLVGRSSDVVVLDLGLPDVDGLDVARAVRARRADVLLLVLTARGDDIDVVVGLDAGADDYLVKPVSVTVLLARLRAHLRRRPDESRESGESGESGEQVATLAVADLTLDLHARRCAVGGVEADLRFKEFDLLATLLARAGSAVSREELMARVWDENWFGSTKTLDVTMASLRARLNDARRAAFEISPERPVVVPTITTLRGFGYRLETG